MAGGGGGGDGEAAQQQRKRPKKQEEITVVVGSASKPKVEAARLGFERLLPPGAALSVTGVEVPSGVAAQPFGFEETRRGALQRLEAARGSAAGRSADFAIAFEGGVENDAQGRKVCFAVICVQYRDDPYISEVRSATHSLPPGVERLLDEGQELGLATDRFFAERVAAGYGKSTGGTIGALTGGAVDRVEYYAHPAALALVPFANAEAYGVSAANPLRRGPGDSGAATRDGDDGPATRGAAVEEA